MKREPCNELECRGDETCKSELDLIILLDASGSITSKGFQKLQKFASKLIERLDSSSQVAVVQFGNGKLEDGGVVADAISAVPFSNDMSDVSAKINSLSFQKGFTNLAQALLTAKSLQQTDPKTRSGVAQVVLVITDGRPSFKFQTKGAVEAVRRSSRLMFVHVKKYRPEDEAVTLKGYASEPWTANYIHVEGKKYLEDNYDAYAAKLLADICPELRTMIHWTHIIGALASTKGTRPSQTACNQPSAHVMGWSSTDTGRDGQAGRM